MTDLDELFATFALERKLHIAAPPDRVWDLVTDVRRIGEFSPECVHAEWLDGATGPEVGARFAGTNRIAGREWTRTCTVVESEPLRRFSYVVGDRYDGAPSGRWTFELEPEGEGTILVQRYQHEPSGRSGARILAEEDPSKASDIVTNRSRMLAEGMEATLEAMRDVLETPH